MPHEKSEQEDAAPQQPGFTTPTKAIRNDGAAHAVSNAARMDTESEADVEKEFDKSTGKKRSYTGPIVYRVVQEWTTGPQAMLEDREIEHQIYIEMKNYMHASGLKKTPGHKQKDTDIHLWKQCTKAYYNKTDVGPSVQMPDALSIWMSSAGETNHRREFQAPRICTNP